VAEARVAGVGEQLALPEKRSRGFWAEALRRLLRSPAGVAGLVIVVLITLIALIGPLFIPWPYYDQDIEAVVAYGSAIPPGVDPTIRSGPTAWAVTSWPAWWTGPRSRSRWRSSPSSSSWPSGCRSA
jgi:hypothetical protein